MAVARVFGRVDGVDVVMEQTQGDTWSVPVPLDQDGEYVVEIIAVDEAENQSYMAKMLFCVDSSRLCVRVLPVPYYAELLDGVYYAAVLPAAYHAELLESCCQCGKGG